MSAIHAEVGPSQRGPLTQSPASPRSRARGSKAQSASSGAGQDAGTSLSVAGRQDYRRCCSQGSLGMSATHVRGRPMPKRPLNAKPRIAAQQSQGESVEVRILRRRTGRGNITASGRAPGLPALPSAGQPRNERHPCPGRPKPKRPLNAKPGHRRAAGPGGKRRGPHPPAQDKTREHRCQSKLSGVERQTRTSLQAAQARVLQRRTAIDNTPMLCQLKAPLMPRG